VIPFNLVVPDTFNELKLVKLVKKYDCPDKLFNLFNIVVDVLFKLLIDNVELVDKLFKLLNIVVEVLFKLLIDNVELVDKLLTFVVDANTGSEDTLDEIDNNESCVESS
jgi:hypothetical protein